MLYSIATQAGLEFYVLLLLILSTLWAFYRGCMGLYGTHS